MRLRVSLGLGKFEDGRRERLRRLRPLIEGRSGRKLLCRSRHRQTRRPKAKGRPRSPFSYGVKIGSLVLVK